MATAKLFTAAGSSPPPSPVPLPSPASCERSAAARAMALLSLLLLLLLLLLLPGGKGVVLLVLPASWPLPLPEAKSKWALFWDLGWGKNRNQTIGWRNVGPKWPTPHNTYTHESPQDFSLTYSASRARSVLAAPPNSAAATWKRPSASASRPLPMVA